MRVYVFFVYPFYIMKGEVYMDILENFNNELHQVIGIEKTENILHDLKKHHRNF